MTKNTKTQSKQVLSLLAGFAAGYLIYNRYLAQKFIKETRNQNQNPQ